MSNDEQRRQRRESASWQPLVANVGDREDGAIRQVQIGRLPSLAIASLIGVCGLVAASWVWSVETRAGVSHFGSLAIGAAFILLAIGSFFGFSAVRQRQLSERRLERAENAAMVDTLTGLPNRSTITTDIRQRLAERQPGAIVGVMFCDIDRLKVVNDSLGHGAGDEILRVIAAESRLDRLVMIL